MSVDVYIWVEIIKAIFLVVVLILFAASFVFSIIADLEKRKAYKGLQKGFHVEFNKVESGIDLEKVADELSKRLKKVTQ